MLVGRANDLGRSPGDEAMMNRNVLVAVLAGVSMALMADEEPFEAEEVWNCGGDLRLVDGDTLPILQKEGI